MRTPYMRFQLLQQDIGWNFEYNVGHKENSERGIVLRPRSDVEVRFEPEYGRIADVDTIPGTNCYENYILLPRQQEAHTDPGKQADTGRRDTGRCASQSWP